MKKYIKYILLLSIFSCSKNDKKNEDDFYEKCRKLVLNENKKGQEYHFKIIGKEINELHLKYLGYILNYKYDTLKIVNSQSIFGYLETSKKGNGSIYIYNTENQLIGFYFLGDYWAVPNKIEDSKSLVFDYKNDFCNQTTKVSLSDSIPKSMFISCTKNGGDIYNFTESK